MSQDELKLLLLRDKAFLKRLFTGPNLLKNKEILHFADESELNTLLKYLHFVANGKITISKENFNQIKESKKLKLIQLKVEKMASLLKLLNGKRQDKISFLLKLSSILPNLLYGLFNLK